jgi:alpha-mannosidase
MALSAGQRARNVTCRRPLRPVERTSRVPVDGGEVREVDLIEWDLADGPQAAFEELTMPASPTGRRGTEPDRDSSDATLPAERMAPGQRRRDD